MNLITLQLNHLIIYLDSNLMIFNLYLNWNLILYFKLYFESLNIAQHSNLRVQLIHSLQLLLTHMDYHFNFILQ